MEIYQTTYACSPAALSGACSEAHTAGTATAYGLGRTSGVMTVAPVSLTAQGTGVSIAMRDRTAATQATRTTALFPISDVAATLGVGGLAGIRSWSPPV